MTEQDRSTKMLVNMVILFVTVTLLGSFVVSFNLIDLAYLLFFHGFLLVYKLLK